MRELTDYIATLDEPERNALERIHALALDLVPDATEGMSYGMAALRYRDRPLLAVRAASGHLSLFPFNPEAIAAVAAELEGFSLSKGTVRFQADKPVPDEILSRIIVWRKEEIDAGVSSR